MTTEATLDTSITTLHILRAQRFEPTYVGCFGWREDATDWDIRTEWNEFIKELRSLGLEPVEDEPETTTYVGSLIYDHYALQRIMDD